jgi:LDH2 family malate/lactate/ureidoglycolate dehydrogenase
MVAAGLLFLYGHGACIVWSQKRPIAAGPCILRGEGTLMTEIRVHQGDLLRFATAIFSATGMSAADAATVADVLVWANERGVDSHGVIRIPIYLKEIREGTYKPKGQPTLHRLLPATFKLECNRAPGPVCMMRAAALAIDVAQQLGVAVGLVSDPTHIGALGRYAQWIAERGYAALVIVAGLPFMAYHGARDASVATSPIAIAIPNLDPKEPPLLLDMATSIAASGRIRQAASEGKALPEGIAIDAQGRPTTDPRHAATLLSLGGAKGSGLSLMFECLTGILAATPIIAPPDAPGARSPIQNSMIVAFNIENFRRLDDYSRDVQRLRDKIKRLPLREGFDEVRLPGERGDREAKLRRENGIPLPDQLWTELVEHARQFGIAAPATAGSR